MPSQRNVNDLEYLKDRVASAKAVVFADYKGLTVAQITDLRNQIKALAAEMKVTKNTLIKLALKASNLPTENINKELTGPTAVIFAMEDEVSAIKAAFAFANNVGLPKFKAGFLASDYLTAAGLKKLAELPSKEVLLAKTIGTLNAPLFGLANVLQGNLRKLVGVLEAVKDKNLSTKS